MVWGDGNHKPLKSKERFFVDVISVAGVRNPKLTSAGRMIDSADAVTRDKIRGLFRIAALHGNDGIILGALGCGCFHCPAGHVSEIFA